VFSNGKEYPATDVWRDENTEVAVIKIDAQNLPALEWGDSKSLKVGEWALAIGSPMEFGNTVTSGIVSATSTKDRWFAGGKAHDFGMIRQKTGYAIEDYIQTEAAINPGNSGGPLVTLTGKVVGINTLIVSSSRTSAGLGFAVPEKIAQSVVTQLIRNGKVVRGHLGVMIISAEELNDEVAMRLFRRRNADDLREEYHILKDDKGVLVAELVPDGPAEKAGFKVGDMILRIDDTDTGDPDVLKKIISAKRPDAKVTVTLRRKGREQKIEVVLGEQPVTAVAAAAMQGEAGLTVETLTPDVAEFLGYDKDLKGVVVTGITRGSPADQAELQLRDVIEQVNNRAVADADAFSRAMREARGKRVALQVKRGKRDMLIFLKP
ncbi:MAG: PDZ domain-containing protein, partial [Pseudomonadota bacterium]